MTSHRRGGEYGDENRRIGFLQDAEEDPGHDNPVNAALYPRPTLSDQAMVRGYHINPCGLTYDKDVTILQH